MGAGGRPLAEDDLYRQDEMSEDAQEEEDSMADLAELYKKTFAHSEGMEELEKMDMKELVEFGKPLSEFVFAALSFHIDRCAEDGVTPNAISRTFLLLHLLLQDAATIPALWPINGTQATRAAPQSFHDIVSRLDPSMAYSGGGDGDEVDFDPTLCHLRRVLFWLESTCSNNVVDERMKDLFQGLTAYR